MSVNAGGARVTGTGDTLVQTDGAESASEARGAETGVGAQSVHTMGVVLTPVVLTVINVLTTKLSCIL